MSNLSDIDVIKIGKRTVFPALLVVTLVIVIYALITRSYVGLIKVNFTVLITAVCIELTAWFISAIRLRIIHRILDGVDKVLSIKHYFYARLLGGFMAYLTPSAIGGEPARAYYLYMILKNTYSRYLALALYEVFYDIVIVNTLAISLSISRLPYTIPVILVSLVSLTTWILVFNIFKNIALQKHTRFSRISKFIESRVISKMSFLTSAYIDFGMSFREIVCRTKRKEVALISLLTIMMYLTSSLAITVIAISLNTEVSISEQYINSFHALLYSLSLGALPTPGGSMAIEYGLSIVLKPEVVVVARTLFYYLIIISGAIVLFRIGLRKITTK